MNSKNANGIKWYQSILFQVIAINIVMLIAFNVVMYSTMGSLDNTVGTSTVMIDYVASVGMHESDVSSDVYFLYSQPYAYLTADDATKQEIETDISEVSSELLTAATNLTETFAKSNDANSVNGYNLAKEMEGNVSAYVSKIKEAFGYAQAYDTDTLLPLMNGEVKNLMETIDAEIEACDECIGTVVGGSIGYMEEIRGSAIRKSVMGLIMFLIFLTINFIVSVCSTTG